MVPVPLLFAPLLAVQVAIFALRINREATVEERGGRTWLPVSDKINILSLPVIAALCAIGPLAGLEFERVAKTALAVGYTLIVLYPITIANHYRLFHPNGRKVYTDAGRDYPPVTEPERIWLRVTLVAVIVVARFVWLAR